MIQRFRWPAQRKENKVKEIYKKICALVKEEGGATAVEYAIMAAFIAAVIIAVVGFLGTDVNDAFTTVETNIDNQAGG
jgi:pilus assembly protein Flp/PilA